MVLNWVQIQKKIKENAKIELRHYGYDNVLESINSYMYQNMKNNRTFFSVSGRGQSDFCNLFFR